MILRQPLYTPTWGLGSAFEELERMRRQLDGMFENLERRPYRVFGAGVFPLINLTEDGENYYVRSELPGLKSDEINISVTGNSLSISGERKIPSEGEKTADTTVVSEKPGPSTVSSHCPERWMQTK